MPLIKYLKLTFFKEIMALNYAIGIKLSIYVINQNFKINLH